MITTPHRVGGLLVAGLLALVLFSLTAFTEAPSAHAAAAKPSASKVFKPTENRLRAAAKRASTNKTARAAAAFPVSIRWEWWGARVMIDRSLGCWAVQGRPEAEALIKAFVPAPWNYVVLGAINVHKWLINARMGAQGVELHFNWSGTLHWVAPTGTPLAC